MTSQLHIQRSKCGMFNVNKEHCGSCGAMLSVIKQCEIGRTERDKKTQREALEREPRK